MISNKYDDGSNNHRTKWVKKDFRGIHEINRDEPVVNVSYYEADVYAAGGLERDFQPNLNGKRKQAGMIVCVEKLFILGETKDLSLNMPICKNRSFGAHLVWVHILEGKKSSWLATKY